MIEVKFEFRIDEDYGTEGWIPVERPEFNASSGLGVAHDCLEHFELTGTLESELHAFGVMLYARGEPGFFWKGYNPSIPNVLGSDLADIIGKAFWQTEFKSPGQVAPLEGDMEGEIYPIIRKCLENLQGEWFDGENPASFTMLLQVARAVKNWLRKGYMDACEKYGESNGWRLCDLFEQIQKAVDGRRDNTIGDMLTVKIDSEHRLDMKFESWEDMNPPEDEEETEEEEYA